MRKRGKVELGMMEVVDSLYNKRFSFFSWVRMDISGTGRGLPSYMS